MSTVKLKRSATPGKVPTAGNLELGEIAINTHDGKVYLKKDANGAVSVVEVGRPDSTDNVLYVSQTGNDSNDGLTIGSSFLTIEAAIAAANTGTTIFVKSGDYVLDNSAGGIEIPANVSLYGDNLRTTSISGANTSNDLFYVNSACYLTNFTFRDMARGASAISFPPSGLVTTGVYVSPYVENCTALTGNGGTGMKIDGSKADGLKSMVSDSFTQINAGTSGHNPNAVSLLTRNREFLQDEVVGWINDQVTNGTSPFATTFTYDQAKCRRDVGLIVDAVIKDLDESPVGDFASNVHSRIAAELYYGTDGASRVIGQEAETAAAISRLAFLVGEVIRQNTVSPTYSSTPQDTSGSPRESGARAHAEGNVDFIATAITGGLSTLPTEVAAGGIGVHLLNAGYAQLVSIFTVSCHIGILAESGGQCSLTNSNCAFGNYGLRATGAGPTLYSGTTTVESVNNVDKGATIQSLTQKPRYGDVVLFSGINKYYTVEGVSDLGSDVYRVTFRETLTDDIPNATSCTFHQRSMIAASSITFEYVGTGTGFYDTPQSGAFPLQQNEVQQDSNNQGQVYFTSTDQRGDFRIGGDLAINRTDGIIEGETFNRSLFNVITPYILALEGSV